MNIVTRSEDLWHQGGAVGDAALFFSRAVQQGSRYLFVEGKSASERYRYRQDIAEPATFDSLSKALATKYRASLRRVERNRCFATTGRAFDANRNFLALAICSG